MSLVVSGDEMGVESVDATSQAVGAGGPKPKSPLRFAFEQQLNVMSAVVLRDVRTRFFDHGLGFLMVPLFPTLHLFVLIAISKLVGRYAPYGDSLIVFFATGLLPTLTFMYVSRFMAMSLLMNRPMLAFPAVRMMDIVLARAFLDERSGMAKRVATDWQPVIGQIDHWGDLPAARAVTRLDVALDHRLASALER